MRNVVLIISHKRPQCSTVKALKKAGYKGDWFIVADDMDDTDYEGLYNEHVVRFSKMEYAKTVDTADNFGKMTTPVYARNACFDIAREKGYDCFALLDDDLTGFVYRYVDGKKLASKKVRNITPIFDAYCKYVLDSGFACGGFVSAGRLIGGVNNPLIKKGGFYYNPTNAYIINTHAEQFGFIGTLWEDSIYCYLNNMTGRIAAAFMPIVITMTSPSSMEDGGNKDLYTASSAYVAECYGNMAIPSFFRWTDGCRGHRFSSNVPRIINERWRKWHDAE